MSRTYRNNNIGKTLKDYAVPLVGLLLILILLYNVVSDDSVKPTNTEINQEVSNITGIQIDKDSQDVKVFLVSRNEKKSEIEDNITLQKGEKIELENGIISLNDAGVFKMKLQTPGEFSYKEDSSYFLESGNLWVEALSSFDIYTKYATVHLRPGDIVNISQNMVETTVYALNNNIKVTTLYGIDIDLEAGNKIIIKANETNSGDFDIKANTNKIDDYFKFSDWFKVNKGDIALLAEEKTNTGETLENLKLSNLNDIIEFDNLVDESYSKDSKLKITGRVDTNKVGEVTFNNKQANLDTKLGTFSFDLNLNSKVNDIIVKIFDNNKNLISKKVYTIYNSNGNSVSSGNIKTKLSSNIENYKVDATKFIIYEPTTTGKLTTTSSQITIRGKVLDKNIKSVLVNDYKLRSFNGSTWRYHAFVEQGTLKPGANLYEIKYLDKDGNVVYKEYYSIYKKIKTNSNISKTVKKISDEAQLKTDS